MHSTVTEMVERLEELGSPDVAGAAQRSRNHHAAMLRVPISESIVQVPEKKTIPSCENRESLLTKSPRRQPNKANAYTGAAGNIYLSDSYRVITLLNIVIITTDSKKSEAVCFCFLTFSRCSDYCTKKSAILSRSSTI